MRIPEKISFLILTTLLIIMGCAPNIPISGYPLEIERSFHASFDKTWDSVLEVVKISNGIIITEDKSSGLIVYSVLNNKSRIYMNVYLKKHPTTDITLVYLNPRVKFGYYLKEIDRDFFTTLDKTLSRR